MRSSDGTKASNEVRASDLIADVGDTTVIDDGEPARVGTGVVRHSCSGASSRRAH
jgi:hypothetical protein